MAYLPDTEENMAMEEAAEKKKSKGGFGAGFVTGAAAALICVSVFFAGWIMAQRAYFRSEEAETKVSGAEVLTDSDTLYKLNEIQAIIEECYYDEVDGAMLEDYLFKGVAVGLDDPYADYYSVQELQSVMDSTRGEYYGIGATLSENVVTGEIVVMEVYEDSPASQGGLKVGDSVLAVGDQVVPVIDLSDMVTWIKGNEEPFTMRIYREETDEELELTLQCGEIRVTHVQYEMKEDQIGYIRISEFTETAVDQFETALEELNAAGMEKLIVDLRNNPGGLLDSVCDILDLVLPKGLIVYTEDKNGQRQEYESEGKPIVDCEIAVLVNGYSASASEIFAGAVQDYELGPVIGTQTYGKGVVQKTYPLSDGSAFKLTVEKYFTPKGQDIDGNGITPDIIVEETEDTAETETLPETEDAAETENLSEAEDTDLVLERALENLRKE